MGEYPKYPNKYHWRKRFLIPKTYLYKMRIVEGLTVQEIVNWHHKEFRVKISKRTVEYYLSKFKIYKPVKFVKKKKYKRPIFNKSESVWYLNRCFQFSRYPFRYLDKLNSDYRKIVVNRFFKMASELGSPSPTQRKILWCLFKKYEVSSLSADLFFLERDVMIEWGKVDEIRESKGLSISGFCRKINIDRRYYQRAVVKGVVKTKRKTILKAYFVLRCKQSDFSKEIKYER